MSDPSLARVASGTPAGGQFASGAKAVADLGDIDLDVVPDDDRPRSTVLLSGMNTIERSGLPVHAGTINQLREVGERIRSRMPARMSQRMLAERAQMSPDALARTLSGRRGLSISELTGIAQELGPEVDAHWLLTGEPDPLRVEVVARCSPPKDY